MAPPPGYYDRPMRGPSPWIPVTILGIFLLVVSTPYRTVPDVAMAYHPGAVRRSASFGLPPALIWIPVIILLLVQFFGGGYSSYYNRRRPLSYGGVGYGDAGLVYPGAGAYNDVNYIRYNGGPYADRGYVGSFMDFGGHWLLILLGIWLFSLFGAGSAPVNTTASRWGFPWSLFAPPPPIVMPVM